MSFITVLNGQFIKDGQPFRWNGTNAYYLPVYQHINSGVVTRAFDTFEHAGVKCIRMWAFYDGPPRFQNERTMQPNPGQYNEDALKDLDKVIDQGKSRGFTFILSFVNFLTDLGGITVYNGWANESSPGDHNTRMEKFITGSQQQGWYKDYIEMLLTRENTETTIAYKDEPAIMAWEIINEGRINSANDDGTTIRDWYQEIAQHIKSIDSNHLVTTGEEGFEEGTPSEYSLNEYSDLYPLRSLERTSFLKNTAIPEIDFGRAHWYPADWGFGRDFATNPTTRANILRAQEAWIKDHNDIAAGLNKPFCICEWGYHYRGSDRQEILNQLYVPFYRTIEEEGVSGSFLWQLVAGQPKQEENGGNISYPLNPSFGRQDHVMFAEFQKHSINMSETPEQDPPDVVDSSITVESSHQNQFTVSVNAAEGGTGFRYKLYYSTSDNLGTTPGSVEENGMLADERIDEFELTASELEPDTQYWYTVLVENSAGDQAIYDVNDLTTLEADSQPPVVSDSSLTSNNFTAQSFTVNFTKATDADSPDEELIYKLYISKADPLDGSIGSIENAGELKDTGTDVDLLRATGLFHSTEYFFNIIVEDLSGNKTTYTANNATTEGATGIDRNHPMAQGLVAYYQFDQGSGVIINDIANTDNVHNAVAHEQGGAWNTIDGQIVWSKRDGESEWLEIPNHADFNFGTNSPFTLGLVCAFGEDNNFWNYLLSKGHYPGYNISYAGWDDLLNIAIGSVAHEENIGSGIKNNLNKLHSIVLVVTTASSSAALYIDGSFVVNIDLSEQDSLTTSEESIYLPLPSNPENSQVHYNKFAVWRRALFAQEVAAWHENRDLMLAGVADTDKPVVPDGTLIASNVTANSFTVNFEKATDNETPQEELIYRLYTSTSDNVSTASEAQSNGMLQDTRTDTNLMGASGLDLETEYWFNVVVEDLSGNRTAYTVNDITTVSEHGGIDTNHPMAQDLVAYYQFEQGGGTTVLDISNSPNAHDAEAQDGGAWNTVSGQMVWSKRQGENEWLQISDHNDFNFGSSSAFTLGLVCAFAEDNVDWNFILSKGHHPGYNIAYAGWDDIIRIAIGSVTDEIEIGTGIKNDLDNLHSIVLSVAGVDEDADLFVDGSFVATIDLSGQGSTSTSSIPLKLPHNTTPASSQMHYNRFAVWGRALSAQEISDWHNNKDIMLAGVGDTIDPEVSDGTLIANNLTDKAFTVTFEKATDNATPQSDLVYRLYTSTSNNVSTVGDAETNGTLQDTRTNTDFLNATGLTTETEYWFNVVVEDLSGNRTAYTTNTLTTIALEGIDTTHSMADDLVAYYQFDQGEGVVVHDISNSANAHDAQLQGGAWGSINGDMVWSKREGESAWLEIPDHGDLDFGTGSPFTIGLVCAFGEDNDIWNFLFSKGNHPGYSLSYAGWTNQLRVTIGDMSKSVNIDSEISNDLDHLHSIVLAVAAANDEAVIYVDGSLVDTLTLTCQISSATSDDSLMAPYQNPPGSSQIHYNKLAVWSRELSAQEVSDWHQDRDLMLLESAPASDFYYTIEDDNGLRVNGNNESYFPLSLAPSGFWSKVRPDGGDIRVTLDDGTTHVARAVSDFDVTEERGKLFFDSSAAQASVSTTWRIYYGSGDPEPAFDSEFGRNNAFPSHIAAWKLDSLDDSSGNNHPLTAIGGPSLTEGKLGQSYSFNGTDQYLRAAHHEDLNINPPFTISFWIKPTTTTNFRDIVNKHGGTVFAAGLDNGILYFGANDSYVDANTAIDEDEWTFVHLTFTGLNTVRDIYLNGDLDKSLQFTGLPSDNIDPVYIGVWEGEVDHFQGQIEEVNIVDGVRSADWIEEEFNIQSDPNAFWTAGSEQTGFVAP